MNKEASLLIPFLKSARQEIFLLRDRSRGRSRRGKSINLLNGNHACLAASEIIKILLCDSSLIINGGVIFLAEAGKDLECLHHTLVANRKRYLSAII